MYNDLYEIQVLDSLEYKIIVYSRGVNTLSDYVKEVASQLLLRNYTGVVLFDLLLSNGVNDRYYILNFNGRSFEYDTLRKLNMISNKIHNISNNYYKSNIDLLELLNSRQRCEYLNQLLDNEDMST